MVGSEGYHGRLRVAEFLKVLLAGELDHGRGSAHEDHGLIGRGGEALFDHLRRDEASLVLPPLRREVQGVVHREAPAADLHGLLQQISAEDVVLRLVRVDQREGASVVGVPQSCGRDLQHRCEAGAACQHAHVLHGSAPARQLERSSTEVLDEADGTLYVHVVANLLLIQEEAALAAILPIRLLPVRHSDLSWAVNLDYQVDVPGILVACHWGVLALDLLLALVRVWLAVPLAAGNALCRVGRVDDHMLAHWEAKDHVRAAQGEPEALGVMRELLDVDDLHLLSLLVEERFWLIDFSLDLEVDRQADADHCRPF
mmetsp:Transcript_57502/g.115194  ORF Transcript_57502/g.115194 Transcript_57502/m.115194 type:complete len:314 (+) Transcript_57502:98-1039(+)